MSEELEELIDKLLFMENLELVSEVLKMNKELEIIKCKHLIVRTKDFQSFLNIKEELETIKNQLKEAVSIIRFYAENGTIEESTEWFPGQKAREYFAKLEGKNE